MRIYCESLFAQFVISNAVAKIKASTYFGSVYILCISCCEYNNQKILLRVKSCDLQIFFLTLNSCYTVIRPKNHTSNYYLIAFIQFSNPRI